MMKKIIFKMWMIAFVSTLISAVALEAKNLELNFENFCEEWKEGTDRQFGKIRKGTEYKIFKLEYTNDKGEKVTTEKKEHLGFYSKKPSPLSRGKTITISLEGVDSKTTLSILKVTAEGSEIKEQYNPLLAGLKRWKYIGRKKVTFTREYRNVKNGDTIIIGAPGDIKYRSRIVTPFVKS